MSLIFARGALDIRYEVAAGRRSKKAAARRIDRRSKKAAGVCFVSSRPQTEAEVDHNFFVIRLRKKGKVREQQEPDQQQQVDWIKQEARKSET
ncbi:hypothetical protein E3N88_05416 [Mikania micrantha]|uniref:Uncharacterized protein n=1 Tax=Mikania micrantha TaxID=192012 RepID=A0A5N6PN26_9ASTR|nr:hypothetical protein E3N88_05416 [Mikania micrantha]